MKNLREYSQNMAFDKLESSQKNHLLEFVQTSYPGTILHQQLAQKDR